MNFRMWMMALSALSVGCTSSPTAVCREYVEAFAKRVVACEPTATLSEAEASIERVVTMSRGCNAVVSIRDEAAFRSGCLPAIPSVACSALQSGPLPESCAGQIQVPR